MILAATGHRPDKLGGYVREIELAAGLCMLAYKHLAEMKPDEVISGMALGWDTAVAEAALMLNIPLICAVPFESQDWVWPKESQEIYRAILARAKQVEIISDGGYAAWKMRERNKWMVDRADAMLALWDGLFPSGTANCIQEAKKKNLPITNVWDEWSKR